MSQLQIFKNIYFTKGINRTLVFDSLKTEINFIPNDLYDVLLKNNFLINDTIVGEDDLSFLKQLDLLHEINDDLKDLFIDPHVDISIPYHLAIAIIEISIETTSNLYKLLESETSELDFGQFNFIFSDFTNIQSIKLLSEFIKKYEIDAIEFTILEGFRYVNELFFHFREINSIIVVNNFTSSVIEDKQNKYKNRMYNNSDVKSLKISPEMSSYLGSEKHNIYYHNKIFFGRNTEIKNSNESNEVFGYLKEFEKFDINNFLSIENFKKYWYITKNDTLICSDCEFRRLCNDNRLPLERSKQSGLWFHKEECQYNPFISKWSDDEGYLNLKDSGVIIDKDKITYDDEKLLKINEKLWNVDEV